MGYSAPVNETNFYIRCCTSTLTLPASTLELDAELTGAILDEAGSFASDVLLPLDRTLDTEGVGYENGTVTTAPGHRDAYRQFREGGWLGISMPEVDGGQDLPPTVTAACQEFWHSGSMAFSMGTLLTMGAAETLKRHASEEQRRVYLPKLVSGEWAATMALTEPGAGSDLGDTRTRAEPLEDGSFLVRGTKIFISYGDHDLTENIVHLVLARLPDASAGSRGLSLFLVPKKIPDRHGILHQNDVLCTGIEEKLGQHGSPTCTMAFGSGSGAKGWIVGEPHRGLTAMFTMMNSARLAVAMQGVAIGERATQAAFAFASERRQGRLAGRVENMPIADHPDVWRMLMTMRSTTTAARFIALSTADAIDRSRRSPSQDERDAARIEADILTPVAKAYCTDSGIENASLAIQIHGGMGYVQETGIAQLWRDARVTSIYEGTNGIHAIDLLTRKLTGPGAPQFLKMIDQYEQIATRLADVHMEFADIGQVLSESYIRLRSGFADMTAMLNQDRQEALRAATPFLRLVALVTGASLLARAVLACSEDHDMRSKLGADLRFFSLVVLAETAAISSIIVNLPRLGGSAKGLPSDGGNHAAEGEVRGRERRTLLEEKA